MKPLRQILWISILREEPNDAPAAPVTVLASRFDWFGTKIAFSKIPVFFHGGKDTRRSRYQKDKIKLKGYIINDDENHLPDVAYMLINKRFLAAAQAHPPR